MANQGEEDFLKNANPLGNPHVVTNLEGLDKLPVVRGPNLDQPLKSKDLLDSFKPIGIQASVFSQAVDIINSMYSWKLADQDKSKVSFEERDLEDYFKARCQVYLGVSANLMSSGTRDVIRYLLKYRMADVLVLAAGGVEEDIIKCLGDYKVAGFESKVPPCYEKQGNIWVPKDLQNQFKKWFKELIGKLHDQQDVAAHKVFTPSDIIREMGLTIADERSCLYWAAKNQIPVFAPAFTDSFMGECLFEYNLERPGFIIDGARDVHLMDKTPHRSKCTGALIFGAGIVKHHILNANLMRNGVNYCVCVNTGSEWEASDSGAKLTEAISWGKIRLDGEYAKIYGDVNVVAPLLVAGSIMRDKEVVRRDRAWEAFTQSSKK